MNAMDSRPPAPHVVVVHAREVVMDERVRVHDLDCRGERARILRSTGGAIGSEKQQPAKPLSSADEAVPNRFGDGWFYFAVETIGERGKSMIDRRPIG